MDMPELDFETAEAKARWQAFLRDLNHQHRNLPSEDRDDLVRETVSHIAEGLAGRTAQTELALLGEVLDRYGPLEPAPPAWRKPAAVIAHPLRSPTPTAQPEL